MAATNDGARFRLRDVPALAEAVASGQLLILAGAGISRLGPSFLPDWYGFNRALLEEAKACALRGLPALDDRARAGLQSLAIDQIPVEAFSDLVVRSFAAEGYFTVLDVLDAQQSNANHQALAALARRGILRTIVTTNFDTLVERAFREADVPLDVVTVADLGDTSIPRDPRRATMYKVHGSVTSVDTLVDTVSQKLRGLPEPMRERLAQLYPAHHVLVLGYSGGDLRFGTDYLALSAIDGDTPGLTWVVRPGSEASDDVRAVVGRVGERGAIVAAELPAFFGALDVQVSEAYAAEDRDARAEAEARVAVRVRRFFDEPYVGALSSAAFCASLLSRVGHREASAAVRDALAAEVERWGGRLPRTAGTVLRSIATGRMAVGDVAGAHRWAQMEVAFWESVRGYLNDAAPHTLAAWQRNMAAALMNRSVVHRARGALDEASASLKAAIELANAAGHPGLRAIIYGEAATLAGQMDDDLDQVIDLWRRSVSAAVEDGGAGQLANALIELAHVLLRIGEYDLAWTEVDRAAQQLPLVVNADTRERIELVRAAVNARRGSASGALSRLAPLVAQHPADTQPGARARVALARFIGSREALRSQALAMLDEVLAAMQAGRLPERGLSDVPERDHLQRLRAAVSVGGTAAIITLIQVPGQDEEARLRGQIVLAELTQFLPILPVLYEELCHRKRTQGRWLRTLDLAQGLFHSAKRAGDGERVLAAVNFFTVARAAAGSAAMAVAEMERTLATAAPGTQRDAMARNLAVLRAPHGQWSGDTLLTPLVEAPLSTQHARIWGQARALLEQNDLDGALLVLLHARAGQRATPSSS